MTDGFVLPSALSKGDKVAVVATSGGVQKFPEVIDKGVERLEGRFGLEPVLYDNVHEDTEYLNSHPEEKAEAFMKAFEDPEIKGVIALTGGDEQLRILKYLENDRLRDNPTRFYGISDNTNLHIYLWSLGITSFYGGQILDDLLAEGDIGEYTYSYLEKAFFEDSLGELEASEKFTDEYFDLFQEEIVDDRERFEAPEREFWNFEQKTVEGLLFGGCFEIMDWQLAAEKYLPENEELEGCILALETSEEAPSITEIKRSLISMGEKGFLQNFSAIIIATPMRQALHGEDRTIEEKKNYHRKHTEIIKEEIKNYCPETPVVFNMEFGHTHPKIPLKLGGKLKINPEKQKIKSL